MRWLILFAVFVTPLSAAETPVFATAESTLATGSGQIREFAFDGVNKTCFVSVINPAKDDTFTLTFDQAVTVKSVKALTGQAGKNTLDTGELKFSSDGEKLTKFAAFKDGTAEGTPTGKAKALHLRVTAAMEYPLLLCEITINSDPPVAVFKYPIEFTLDIADAPELKEWATKALRVCKRQIS